MHARCQYCQQVINLTLADAAAGIANAAEAKSKHHVLNCPRCRRVVKIPVKQLKRSLPPGYKIPPAPEPAAADDEAGDEAEDEAEAEAGD